MALPTTVMALPTTSRTFSFDRIMMNHFFPCSPDITTPIFTQEEIQEVQTAISSSIRNTLTTIMSNDQTTFTGIWYPEKLEQFFHKTGQTMPEDYWTGYANTEFFNKTGRFTFELKEESLASNAIKALLTGPSVLDCGNAIQLAYYKALLDILGEHKFNKLFSGELFKLTITQKGITDSKSPISYFADFTQASKRRMEGSLANRPVAIGEECYFQGIPYYANKHPVGFCGGRNVICVGKNTSNQQLFIAHGFNKPMTEQEINRLLVEDYNCERTAQDEHFIRNANQPHLHDKNINLFLKTLYSIPLTISDTAVGGFLVGSGKRLLPESILLAKKNTANQLLKLSLKEVKIARIVSFTG